MGAWEWQKFCGRGENISTWSWVHSDFGYCFEQLAIICSTHCILAIISAFYLAQIRQRDSAFVTVTVRWKWHNKARLSLGIILLLSPLIKLLLMVWATQWQVSLVDGCTAGIIAFTWLIHSVYLWRQRYMVRLGTNSRGPILVIASVMLTVIAMGIQVRTVALQHRDKSVLHNAADETITYITFALEILYLATLIPTVTESFVPELNGNLSINSDRRERESLIGGRSAKQYGSIAQDYGYLGLAEDANFFSKLTFHWVTPMMIKGAQHHIKSSQDLFDVPPRMNTQIIDQKFHRVLQGYECKLTRRKRYGDVSASSSSSAINHAISDSGKTDSHETNDYFDIPSVQIQSSSMQYDDHGNPIKVQPRSLLQALNKAFGVQYYSLGILKLLADGFGFAGPLLLNLLVSYMEDTNERKSNGYIYAAGLFASTLFSMFCTTQFNYNVHVVGLKIRAAIITTVYRKASSVNTVSLSKFNTGEVINFMSTDTDRIVNFCPSFHAFWSLPFQIGVSLYLLYLQVGVAFLAGLAFAIVLIPVNKWLANKIGELSTRMMHEKDSRVKMMSEMLYGIRVLKFYAWEEEFSKKINILRAAELKSLKGRKYLDAWCVYFWATTPVLISILTFTTYSLMGNTLTAAKVFTSLSLFVMLISPLNAFPWVINGLIEAWVSLKRVQSYVALKDCQMDKYYTHIKAEAGMEEIIKIKQGRFAWFERVSDQSVENPHSPYDSPETDSAHFHTQKLVDISLSVKKGMLVGVVGKVGCGKSSLLSAILGEMVRESGSITVADLSSGFALASQEAWIQHASVRDNILFGKPYHIRRYDKVVEACALSDDLKILPAGDRTEIGENGVTLSGGQKARVALARAVYQDKDVYLLDDPLAAVDAHVAKHLFQHCIMGLLEEKTRILCTHHVQYLQKADLVIVLDRGRIISTGPPQEVLESSVTKDVVYASSEQKPQQDDKPSDDITEDGSLVKEEEKSTGVVKLEVYKSYWLAVGNVLAVAILIALLLMQASRNINDWWLSYWVTHAHKGSVTNVSQSKTFYDQSQQLLRFHPPALTDRDTLKSPLTNLKSPLTNITDAEDNVTFYLTVYGCLAGANSICALFRAFLYAYGGIRAAQVVHKRILASVLMAPIGFFDVTPTGRIINRFSTDIYTIDDALPFVLNTLLAQSYGILGSIAITCYGLPWFTLVLVPLCVIYYFVQRYYRYTSREIKRISSVTLSPIYAHFSETLSGLPTIRAFRHTGRFMRENRSRLDVNQRAVFAAKAASAWLGFRLQILGVAMVTAVAFIAVLEHHFQTVNPGLVGLAITYALSITNLLSGVVTSFTETEKQMVSVERAQQYIDDIPSEQMDGILVAPPFWPIQGTVSFHRVHLQYRAGLPDALDGVSFETLPAEKVGIVGRTGSGKSSLFLALFRMVEIKGGEIQIDGINVHHLDLEDLRSRLAIIPQDPFLFSGTVRDNLDPTGEYPDRELWAALDKCHLRETVARLGGLQADVAERGRHFSVGQKQLMCLARALLKRAKVLCIDEATASVDLETDYFIQQTIQEEFKENTVITIAHRINTIMDCDRVMVMRNGKAAEFAPPATLLENPKSLFYKLTHGTYS